MNTRVFYFLGIDLKGTAAQQRCPLLAVNRVGILRAPTAMVFGKRGMAKWLEDTYQLCSLQNERCHVEVELSLHVFHQFTPQIAIFRCIIVGAGGGSTHITAPLLHIPVKSTKNKSDLATQHP